MLGYKYGKEVWQLMARIIVQMSLRTTKSDIHPSRAGSLPVLPSWKTISRRHDSSCLSTPLHLI